MKKMCVIASTILAAVLFAAGCSTTYKPSPKVTAMSAGMSEKEAMDVLYKLMLVRDKEGNFTQNVFQGYWGICNSNGFEVDGKNGAGLKVTKEGVSVNAYRRGKFVKAEGGNNYYERIAYREDLRFANISSITLKEPGMMTTSCGRKAGQTEVSIRETFVRWYALLIPTSEKERFVAAFLKLRPDVTIDQQ